MPLRLDIKRKLLARSDRVKSVDLHPTEPWMLCSLYNGNVHIWNYEIQLLEKSLEVCELPVRTAKFVARKSWVITGSDDMQIQVFNYNTLERLANFEAHSDYVRSIAVHPTLSYFLSCSDDTTIKLWDWDSNFQCKQTFEGHNHYVMQVVFNPKDHNTFASASLDRTVKVWQLGSSQANFTLEGHEKGVNCVDYYHGSDKPYLASGADDRLIKIWDYQNKTCVATLEGHVQNVSAVCFHPDLPIIITGSEDNTLRIWHGNTYRLESTLNYGLDRVWALFALKGQSAVAIGYDEGSIIIKLGREEPAVSMDSSGKVLWCKGAEIQQTNLKSIPNDVEIVNGERLPLVVKDMGACDIYPQSIRHNSNGRFVVVCGDGEYIIYTAMALRNKSFGSAMEFVWATDPSVYAIRESSSSVKVFQNFKDPAVVNTGSSVEGIFGGQLLGVRIAGQLSFYDWYTREMVRRIDIAPKNVYWSDREFLCITAENSFYILKYDSAAFGEALEKGQAIPEDGLEAAFSLEYVGSEDVATGAWLGDCFCYTSIGNRLKYYVGGDTVTVAHLDKTLYILGYLASENRLYLSDKDLNIVSYQLLLCVLNFQTAVMRRDLQTANSILSTIPKDNMTRVAHFLEKQGYTDLALSLSQDPDHRFELALRIGELKVARDIAAESEAPEKWTQLNTVATSKGDFALASDCLLHANDLGALLLLAASFGSLSMMQTVQKSAEEKGQMNVAFLAYLLAGDLHRCLNILIESDRLPEAAMFARTYLPSEVSRVVLLWKERTVNTKPKVSESLAHPDQYENLFPDMARSMELLALREQYASKPLRANEYSQLQANYTVMDFVNIVKNRGEKAIQEPKQTPDKVRDLDGQLSNLRSAKTLLLSAGLSLTSEPDVARSSQCQPDLVAAVGGPDVLMHAASCETAVEETASQTAASVPPPVRREQEVPSAPPEEPSVQEEELETQLLDEDLNLDVDNLDVNNVELYDDEEAEFDPF